MPAHSASNVSTFGISRLTEKPDSRRTRMRGRRTRTRVRRMANELLFTAFVAGAEYTRYPRFRGTGPSVGESAAGRSRRVSVGQNRFAGDHPLAERDQRDVGRRAIDIGSRAEANDADALSGRERLAFVEVADDTARHQPGDQDAGDRRALVGDNAEGQPLVIGARLVEAGIDEAALGVAPRRQLAADRGARDMDVEQIEEDADPRQRVRPH